MKDLARWAIEGGLINEEQLAAAQKLQGDSGVPLPMALIELKLVDEKALVDLVAERSGLPKAPRRMHRMEIAPKALSLVPQDYCWQYNLFPFAIDIPTRRLHVAVVDPEDKEALSEVRRLARIELRVFVAGPKQIEKAIRRHYLDSLVEETNSPKMRYFGYDNITSPGAGSGTSQNPAVPPQPSPPLPPPLDTGEFSWEPPAKARTHPGQGPVEAVATTEVPLPPTGRPRTPPLGSLPVGDIPTPPSLRKPNLTPAPFEAEPPAMEDDLPIVKDNAVVGRLQSRPETPVELGQRLDALEHLLSRLVALLAHDTRDTAGQLARLAEELQGLRRRRTPESG
jgi:hypothetical protein